MSHTYCVYILASRSRNLYTGVTGDLEGRMVEHRQGLVPGFASRYRIFRLVHFERFGDIRDGDCARKGNQGLAARKENLTYAASQSTVGRPGRRASGETATPKADPSPPFAKKQATGFGMTLPCLRDNTSTKSRSLTPVRQKQATGFGMTLPCLRHNTITT